MKKIFYFCSMFIKTCFAFQVCVGPSACYYVIDFGAIDLNGDLDGFGSSKRDFFGYNINGEADLLYGKYIYIKIEGNAFSSLDSLSNIFNPINPTTSTNQDAIIYGQGALLAGYSGKLLVGKNIEICDIHGTKSNFGISVGVKRFSILPQEGAMLNMLQGISEDQVNIHAINKSLCSFGCFYSTYCKDANDGFVYSCWMDILVDRNIRDNLDISHANFDGEKCSSRNLYSTNADKAIQIGISLKSSCVDMETLSIDIKLHFESMFFNKIGDLINKKVIKNDNKEDYIGLRHFPNVYEAGASILMRISHA